MLPVRTLHCVEQWHAIAQRSKRLGKGVGNYSLFFLLGENFCYHGRTFFRKLKAITRTLDVFDGTTATREAPANRSSK